MYTLYIICTIHTRHIVYTVRIYSIQIHTVYTICTIGTLQIIFAVFTVFILYSYCIHTVFILYSYCTHTVFILYSYCAHTVYTIHLIHSNPSHTIYIYKHIAYTKYTLYSLYTLHTYRVHLVLPQNFLGILVQRGLPDLLRCQFRSGEAWFRTCWGGRLNIPMIGVSNFDPYSHSIVSQYLFYIITIIWVPSSLFVWHIAVL